MRRRLTSHATASSCKANSQTEAGVEIGRHDGDGGHEKHSASETDAETLREECLPELLAETQHHEAEDHTKASHEEKEAKVAAVEDGACGGAAEEDAY